jgi:hypothetical protein
MISALTAKAEAVKKFTIKKSIIHALEGAGQVSNNCSIVQQMQQPHTQCNQSRNQKMNGSNHKLFTAESQK